MSQSLSVLFSEALEGRDRLDIGYGYNIMMNKLFQTEFTWTTAIVLRISFETFAACNTYLNFETKYCPILYTRTIRTHRFWTGSDGSKNVLLSELKLDDIMPHARQTMNAV